MSGIEDGIVKHAVAMRISREMALDYGIVQPTPEEAAEMDEGRRRYLARRAQDRRQYREAIEKLHTSPDPLVVALLRLHAPDLDTQYYVDCPGCDFAGYDGEAPEWPCRTIRTVAEHVGVALPEYPMPGAESDEADQ